MRSVEFGRAEMRESGAYPYSLPAVRALRSLELHPAVTIVVGENGSGKSTILEAIALAIGLNAEGGSKNLRFSTRPSHSELHSKVRLIKNPRRMRDAFFLRAESVFTLASALEELGPQVTTGYGSRLLHEQSHGESFLSLVANRLGDDGFYIMDEPEAALSPASQMALLAMVHGLVLGGSQFIIATHSPILAGYPDAKILEFSDDGVNAIEYEDCASVRVTQDFLANRARVLHTLLSTP